MSQSSYGTITITDTNDISQIYMVYAGGSSGSISPTLSWTTINNNTWKRDITQVTGLYIWESTVITKTGITITETNWQDFYHTPVCITGPEGKGVDSIVTKYCNYGTGTPVEAYTGWQNNPPSYNENKPNYWVKNIITYNDNTSVVNIYKDNGITDAMTLAAEANATANEAKDIADEALELVTETDENLIIYLDSQGLTKEALSTPTRYIWKNMDSYINGYTYEKAGLWTKPDYPSGTYMASGYIDTSTSKPTIDTEDYNTYRFNTYMTNSGLYLRYNNIKFTELNTGALIFYYPKQDLSQTSPYVQGESALRINTDGLNIYNKYTGTGNSESETNLANRLALSLTTSGLQLYEAGNSIASFESQFIRLGQSGDSRVQIQNDSNRSGVEIFRKVNDTDGAQSMAWFGTDKSTGTTTARIGYENGARFVTSSNSLDAYSDTNPNNAYFHVDANSLTYGDYTAATTAQVEATNLALAQKTGRYAECPTAAATQLKVATITPTVTGWTLSVGMTITVKFTYANTNTTPKLKVNGYGESLIRSYKDTVLSVDEAKWAAGTIIDFKWNGNNWLLQDMGTEAAKVATNFLSFSSSNGVDVGYTVSGSALSSKVNIKGDGIRLFDGAGNNCAFFGVDSNNPSVRIGKVDQRGHMRITPGSGVRFLREDDSTPMAQLASDGLQIWANDGTNNTSVAFYGAQCRVGPTADKNVYIGNGAINFRDNGTSLGEFTGTTARIGKADNSHVEIGATNGMNIFDQNNKIRLNASSTGISIFDYASSSSTTPINVAQFNTTARIGPADAQHINITTGGLDVYNSNNVSIASFGALTRIGAIADDTTRTEISSNGVKFIYRADSSNSYTLADIEYRNAYGDHTISKSPTYTFGVRGSGHYGKYSFVVGSSNIAAELFSTAFGLGTSATETGSFAEGWSTTASGKYSHAEGYMTTAGYDYQHVMGKCNGNDSNNAFEIGNGTVSAPTNIFQVGWNGDVYTAGALSVRGNFYVDSSGNVNLTLGSHYKINGTNLSASDVGAVRNSYGSLTNVFPQGFTNADSIKVGITGSVKATPTATEDTQYLFGARAIAPVLYNDTTGRTIWTGYTDLNPPTASDVGALPIGGGTLTGNLTVNGKIQGLYKITSTTVATDSIGANSAKAAANYPITSYSTYIDAGYEPVAISGDATDNSAVKAFARIYDDNGTKKIRATFRNNSSSSVSTNYYFYILWLKATSG